MWIPKKLQDAKDKIDIEILHNAMYHFWLSWVSHKAYAREILRVAEMLDVDTSDFVVKE